MKWFSFLLFILGITLSVIPSMVHAEILAMLNYESKPQQTIRREGIAIIDVDPASENFGSILLDIPLPPNLVNHQSSTTKTLPKHI